MSENRTEIKRLSKVSSSMFNPRHTMCYTGTIKEILENPDKYQIFLQDGVSFFSSKRGVENNMLKIGGKIEIVVISEALGKSEIINTRIIE